MDDEEEVHKRFKQREWVSMLYPVLAIMFLAVVCSRVSLSSLPSTSLSQCRIISSDVDLRSSRVCGDCKTKNVLYTSKRQSFRCRYDYYWISIFEVEYRDHILGQFKLSFSETPTELLPLSCRPDFGSALLTKDRFKVNETYDCWYTSGTTKVVLYHDDYYHCQAERPTQIELIQHYISLYIEDVKILLAIGFENWVSEVTSGGFSGALSALTTAVIVQIVRLSLSWLRNIYQCTNSARVRKLNFPLRMFFLVAYLSLMAWLIFHYGKFLGLPRIGLF